MNDASHKRMRPSEDVINEGINGKMKSTKASKQSVLYLHMIGTDYECKDCILFINSDKCLIHGPNDKILATDSCGLFVYGRTIENARPLGIVTTIQSGLAHSKNGFSCKRCEYFDSDNKKCEKVDEQSLGDDKGIIHPDGCCNAWESLNRD